MTKPGTVSFGEGEETRLLGVNGRDMYLCKRHADERLSKGDQLGVPASAANIMFGLAKWPTGKEPCDDCKTELRI